MSPCEAKRGDGQDDIFFPKSEYVDVEVEVEQESDVEEDENDLKYTQVLKRYFGFSNFRK